MIESITDFDGGGIVLYMFVVVLQSIGPDAEKLLDQSSSQLGVHLPFNRFNLCRGVDRSRP